MQPAQNTITANVSTQKTLKVYTGVAARLLSQLGCGVTQREAANACGVTEGLVSQLMAEPDFKAQLVINFEKATQRAIDIDNNYEEIEKMATDSLRKLLPMLHTPSELIKVAMAANAAKRKTAPKQEGSEDAIGNGKKVSRILMPQVIIQNFMMNPNSEIVQVGDREMTTLNASSIGSLVSKHHEQLALENSKPALLEGIPNGKDKWSDL